MGFTEYLQIPELAQRYRKVKQYFFLKESAYDVTSVCQLRCDGCYYFQGEKYQVKDTRDLQAWRAFFEAEKERGITYVVLAGAEPALVPKIIRACYEILPLGTIVSNGLRKIDADLRYRVQLSVWGDSTGDPIYRKYAGGQPGPFCLPVQLKNYKDDDRIIFVYTFNNENIDQLDEILPMVHGEGHKLTFNVFSNPVQCTSPLKMQDTLKKTRDKMIAAMEEYGDTVVYSYYNAEIHTSEKSLHEQFICSYPRAQHALGLTGIGLSRTFRSYRTDLTHAIESDCCIPDTDCADCRHYAAGSAIVSSRLRAHTDSEAKFRAWLDYVDTYLATWLVDYEKGENLYAYHG